MTTEIRSALDILKRYASDLADPEEQTDEVKRQALSALSTLENFVKDKELGPIAWNEIYDTIQPYSQIDINPKQATFYEKVQSLFSTKVNENQRVKGLLTLVDKKRVESISSQFEQEKTKVENELQRYVQILTESGKETFSVSEVMQQIQENRTNSPRLFLSLKDEFNIFKRLLSERVGILEKDPTQISGSSLVSLNQLSQLCQEAQFTFPVLIQKCSEKKDQFRTAILQPNFNDFDAAAIERLQMQRLYRLENLQEVYQQSLQDPSREVTSKFFAPTSAWYVGSTVREQERLELEMQTVGQKHGIQTISDRRIDFENKSLEITETYRTDLMVDPQPFFQNFHPNQAKQMLGDFNQDFVDFSKNGEVRIPRLRKAGEEQKFDKNLLKLRKEREPEWKKIHEENPDARVTLLGVPFSDDLAMKAIALASSLNAVPVMNLTYNEGGNTLMGKNASGPYVIIGRDSFDISKVLMEKDLGREMTEKEVRMAFAIDYGIEEENVFFVEQPGDFHLDMSMAIVGQNTVLVNDAVVAQNLFAEKQSLWLEENIRTRKEMIGEEARNDAQREGVEVSQSFIEESGQRAAEILTRFVDQEVQQAPARKRLEDITARNLEGQGFTVVRVPGRFHYSENVPAMNLFNFVAVKTPRDQNLVVMMGCIDNEYEERFKATFIQHSDQKIDEFHFLSLKTSQDCLVRGGGVSCRTKTISQ
jgi:hypothetical protein